MTIPAATKPRRSGALLRWIVLMFNAFLCRQDKCQRRSRQRQKQLLRSRLRQAWLSSEYRLQFKGSNSRQAWASVILTSGFSGAGTVSVYNVKRARSKNTARPALWRRPCASCRTPKRSVSTAGQSPADSGKFASEAVPRFGKVIGKKSFHNSLWNDFFPVRKGRTAAYAAGVSRKPRFSAKRQT
jgi:hypothetical protein